MHSRRILALGAAALMGGLLTLGGAPATSAQERVCAAVDVADLKVQADTGRGAQDDCIRVHVL
ncbi:hypothetical protein [Streptomyces sp. NPDC001492]